MFRSNGVGKFVTVILIGLVLVFGINSLLYSGEKPRTHVSGDIFNPGDVISADILNEIIERLHDVQEGFSSPDELVGTWGCTSYHSSAVKDRALPNWILSRDGLYISLSGSTITFFDDGDGTFSFTTSAPDPLCIVNPNSHSTSFELIPNGIFWSLVGTPDQAPFLGFYSLTKIGVNKLVFNRTGAGSGSNNPHAVFCQRQNIPPDSPSNLLATHTGLTVNLSWTDNSSDETGFKILRKSKLTDNFAVVATVGANVKNKANTTPAAGDYWYRVRATNANGDSVGSNVIKINVTN